MTIIISNVSFPILARFNYPQKGLNDSFYLILHFKVKTIFFSLCVLNSMYLICPSLRLPVYLFFCRSLYHLFACMTVCLYDCKFACSLPFSWLSPVGLSECKSVLLYVFLTVHMSEWQYMSVWRYVNLSNCMCVWLFVNLSSCMCLPVLCLSDYFTYLTVCGCLSRAVLDHLLESQTVWLVSISIPLGSLNSCDSFYKTVCQSP